MTVTNHKIIHHHVHDQRPRASVRVVLGTLALLLITAAVSYGFVWRAEVRQQEEFRLMIYNISKAMGETQACNE